MGSDQIALRTCNRCLRKAVCILYYSELDLRFGQEGSKNIIEIIDQLDSELAQRCEFYLEEDRFVKPWFSL